MNNGLFIVGSLHYVEQWKTRFSALKSIHLTRGQTDRFVQIWKYILCNWT